MLFFGGFTHLFLPYFFPVFTEAEHKKRNGNKNAGIPIRGKLCLCSYIKK